MESLKETKEKPLLNNDQKDNKKKDTKTHSFTIEELHNYYSNFMLRYREIALLIEVSFNLETDLVIIQSNIKKIEELTSILNEDFQNNSMFLVNHDKQNYLKYFDDIQTKVKGLKEKINPKKKFKFSNRKDYVLKIAKEEEIKEEINFYTDQDLVLSNLCDKTIVIQANEANGKFNLIIENVQNCNITVPFILKSFFSKNVSSCTLKIAGITGGSHLTNFLNCRIFLSTHQMRIHDSNSTLFSLIVNSDPIIEKCHNVKFSNLQEWVSNDELINLLKDSSLKIENNRYSEVQDFQWLKLEKSPHFSIISNTENENVSFL